MSIDRVLIGRLAKALSAFADGTPLETALEASGIGAGQAGRLLSDLGAHLYNQRGGTAPARTEKGKLRSALAYCDGGSRGNPGEAACAVLVFDGDGNELLRRAKRLGQLTSNQAEYEGVILALELAGQLGAKKLEIRMDSELVVRQLEGTYKVRNEGLKPYFARAGKLLDESKPEAATHIPRKDNRQADGLVNAALDDKEPPE
jgi:ribonuclease HI